MASTNGSRSDTSPRTLLLVTLWFAVLAGLLQPVLSFARRGLLDKPIMGDVQIVWMAPAAYVVFFLPVALALMVGARWLPRVFSPRVVFGALAFLTVYSLVLTFERELHWAAVLVLAAGAAIQTARRGERGRAALVAFARRSLPWMAAIVAALGIGVNGWLALSERRALAALPDAPAGAPNVVLIILDTVRAMNVGLNGYDRPTTPNLAAMGREAAVFDRAIATAPWTLPSHASIFTGRFPYETRTDWSAPLDGTHPTLAEVLAGRGYATGGFVANMFYATWESGLSRGFHRYEDFRRSPGQVMRSTGLSRLLFGTFTKSALLRAVGYYEILGRKKARHVNADFLGWVDGIGDRPFFAFLNYFDAHDPYLPPAPFAERFATTRQDATLTERIMSKLGLLRDTTSGEEAIGLWSRRAIDAYDGLIASLDLELSRLFAELEDRGVLDNTVVILTSDHGESFDEHGVSGHGKRLYMQELYVPLMVWYPRAVPGGVRIDEAVTLRGVPATVMDLLDLQRHPFPGVSLARYWEGGEFQRDTVLAELTRESGADDERGAARSLVIGEMHYVRRVSDGREELYDLGNDLTEVNQLLSDSASYDLERFRALLDGPLAPGARVSAPERPTPIAGR